MNKKRNTNMLFMIVSAISAVFILIPLDGVVNKRGAKWQYNEFGQQRRRKRHFWRSA